MSTVLLVGQDEMLQVTRAALLRTVGAETTCCWEADALDILRERRFDLVVLCHSLPTQLSAALAQNIHAKWPGTRVLKVARREWEGDNDAASADIVSPPTPDRLILHAKRLLQADRSQWDGEKISA